MKNSRIIAMLVPLVLLAAAPSSAQSTDLGDDGAARTTERPAAQTDHERAVTAAARAVEVAETSLGPNHPYVAISLSNLASLYVNNSEYAKAEPLYERSLAIWETALGPDHPYVASCLKNLSDVYRAMGKGKEALQAEEEIKRIKAINR